MEQSGKASVSWVILRYVAHRGLEFVEVRDSLGRVQQTVVDASGAFAVDKDRDWTNRMAGRRPRFVEPRTIRGSLTAAAKPMAKESFPQLTCPVFFESTFKHFDINAVQGIYGNVIRCLNIEPRIQNAMRPIVLARQKWKPRARPRLPLRILGYRAYDLFSRVEGVWWVNEPRIREFGLDPDYCDAPSDLLHKMRIESRHILVTGDSDVSVLSGAMKSVRPASRPRLLIATGAIQEANLFADMVSKLPPGISFCFLSLPDHDNSTIQDVLVDFLYNLVHDLPLHDAFPPSALLVADPATNQNLRLSEFFTAELDKMLQQPPAPAVEDVARYVERTGAGKKIERELFDLAASVGELVDAQRDFFKVRIDFEHEGTGLYPMSEVRGRYMYHAHLRKLVEAAAESRDLQEHMQANQERRVDIGLLRNLREWSPRGDSGLAANDLFVAPNTSLKAGARYDVCLRIGLPLPRTLFVETPPPVDLVLPEPKKDEGHELEVVLFEQDFTVLGDRRRKFRLPTMGPSRLVSFPVRAPAAQENAQLRISLYYRDHMLQSFRLKATVENEERVEEERRLVEIQLDFARTEQIQDVDTLGPRKLNIGVNQSPNGTHTFFVKQGDTKCAVSLPQDVLKTQIDVFRDLLKDATKNRGKFSQPNSTAFQSKFRELARQGSALWAALYDRHPELEDALEEVAETKDKVLQFVRHDPNYAFPWAVIYDFELPDEITGQPEAPICLGIRNSKPCGHKWTDGVFCIRGFWGIRHRVEQLMSKQKALARLDVGSEASVLFVQGYKDAHTKKLKADLENDLGQDQLQSLSRKLIEAIWDRHTGPALVVLIGHLETRQISGEPIGPRLVVVPGKQWLQHKEVRSQKRRHKAIEPPQPIVLLLGCGTAAVEMKTLNSLFTSFISAGAAAVVGTECLVFTGLASQFAHDVTVAMVRDGQSFGDAIRLFRRKMMENGNPLGFVFTAFGDADLQFMR